MTSRMRLWAAHRTLGLRTRPIATCRSGPFPSKVAVFRSYASDAYQHTARIQRNNLEPSESSSRALSGSEPPINPLDHQTSQALDSSHINALDDATLEQMIYGGRTVTSNHEGGLSAAQEQALYREGTIPAAAEAEALLASSQSPDLSHKPVITHGDVQGTGHKFGLPRKPYPEGFNMKQRYHPVLEQLSRLLMRDGKLSVAQRNVATVMNFLRTAPAPIYNPMIPLLPGTPPASHLPLNPVLYMTIAIDSVAPLLKVRNIAGAGGGGRALELPVPLAVRQRRRIAIKWILDIIEKKPSKGSGRKQFPHRIAEEMIAVVEGRSGVWEKRKQLHKLGTAARANVGSRRLKVKKKM